MSLVSARNAADRRMVDSCRVLRPTVGHQELDPVTLQLAGPIEIWSGSCMIGERLTGHQVDQGHGDFREHNSLLRIPVSVETEIRIDDVVEILSGNETGTTWAVVAVPAKTIEITRRFELRRIVQEVQHS